MLDESPTSVNLGNDHEFIIKEYSLHWLMPCGKAQSKVIRAYAQSGQYHTIVESCIHLTWYQSHALNLVMSIEFSVVEQRTLKEKGVKLMLKVDNSIPL